MKTFILISKETGLPVYLAQRFQSEDSPVGLLGGPGQRLWYWLDVTALTDEQIEAHKADTFTPDNPPDAGTENAVILESDGTWS